jgi:hypothetical protein
MEYLPNTIIECCNKSYKGPLTFDYNILLCKFIQDYINDECWAITVNNEVLFNSYLVKSFKKKLKDDMIRTHIVKHTSSALLYNISCLPINSIVRIFMRNENSWEVRLNFKNQTKKCNIEF